MDLNYYIISHLITGITSIVLGFLVYFKNRKNNINYTFFLMALSITLWSLSYSIWLLVKSPNSALFWARTLNAASVLIPLFYLHWIICLLKLNKKVILIFYYIFVLIILLFSYTNYFIWGTKEISIFPYFPQANWLYTFWLIFCWGFAIIYSLFLILSNYKKTDARTKMQLNYVLTASVIGFAGGTTNHFLMYGIDLFPPFGSPLVITYPIIFAYAIVAHQLMDIQLL